MNKPGQDKYIEAVIHSFIYDRFTFLSHIERERIESRAKDRIEEICSETAEERRCSDD